MWGYRAAGASVVVVEIMNVFFSVLCWFSPVDDGVVATNAEPATTPLAAGTVESTDSVATRHQLRTI